MQAGLHTAAGCFAPCGSRGFTLVFLSGPARRVDATRRVFHSESSS
jgi:hypothetical protein